MRHVGEGEGESGSDSAIVREVVITDEAEVNPVSKLSYYYQISAIVKITTIIFFG